MGEAETSKDYEDNFAIGHTVCLKSGGPWMTVATVDIHTLSRPCRQYVTCRWYSVDGVLQQSEFGTLELLQRIEREEDLPNDVA